MCVCVSKTLNKYVNEQMVFAYAAKLVMSYDETKLAKKSNLRGNFKDFLDGLISFPINIPGTAFHACLQVRITVHIKNDYNLY